MPGKTYSIVRNPPAAMPWDIYKKQLRARWQALLDREPSPAEKTVQSFWEEHPCLVPGAFGVVGNRSGHYPHLAAVVAQPPLPSYNRRVPDFLWLSTNSEVNQPVLIEIEAPSKQWWTRAGRQTAALTEALDQIAQRNAWFSVGHNVEAFKEFYGLDRVAWLSRSFRPAYLLIYGRRSEANRSSELTRKRLTIRPDDVHIMTFDRLSPDPDAAELFCIRREGDGFRVVSVPPTMTWRPGLAWGRRPLRFKDAAIRANRYMSDARERFLVERARYWDEWAAMPHHGIITAGDRE